MVPCACIFPSPHLTLAHDLHRIKSYLLAFWLNYDLPQTVCPPARGPQAGSVDSAPHFPLKPKHTHPTRVSAPRTIEHLINLMLLRSWLGFLASDGGGRVQEASGSKSRVPALSPVLPPSWWPVAVILSLSFPSVTFFYGCGGD